MSIRFISENCTIKIICCTIVLTCIIAVITGLLPDVFHTTTEKQNNSRYRHCASKVSVSKWTNNYEVFNNYALVTANRRPHLLSAETLKADQEWESFLHCSKIRLATRTWSYEVRPNSTQFYTTIYWKKSIYN